MCYAHRSRLVRTGDVQADKPLRGVTAGPALGQYGYLIATVRGGHPLAWNGASPKVPVHRLVLWNALDGADAPCYWCGRAVQWFPGEGGAELCSDHLDGDKLNNAPENLVPCCRLCNSRRRGGWQLTPFSGGGGAVPPPSVACRAEGCGERAWRRRGKWCREHDRRVAASGGGGAVV